MRKRLRTVYLHLPIGQCKYILLARHSMRQVANAITTDFKGSLTLKALEIVEEIACSVGDFCFIFTLPYGTPLGKMLSKLERRQNRRGQWAQTVYQNLEERKRVHNILYHLKKDGLIEETPRRKLRLTTSGLFKLRKLKMQRTSALPKPRYAAEKISTLSIISFDIPETERRKRFWLRSALKNMGFTMLHKSVWVGKRKLPKAFLDTLVSMQLLQFVHIFSIKKSGSIIRAF